MTPSSKKKKSDRQSKIISLIWLETHPNTKNLVSTSLMWNDRGITRRLKFQKLWRSQIHHLSFVRLSLFKTSHLFIQVHSLSQMGLENKMKLFTEMERSTLENILWFNLCLFLKHRQTRSTLRKLTQNPKLEEKKFSPYDTTKKGNRKRQAQITENIILQNQCNTSQFQLESFLQKTKKMILEMKFWSLNPTLNS